jgi:hypothetical protein
MSCFLNIKQQASTPAIPKETFGVAPTDKIGQRNPNVDGA